MNNDILIAFGILCVFIAVLFLFSLPVNKKNKEVEKLGDKNWNRFKSFKENQPERRFKLIDTYYYSTNYIPLNSIHWMLLYLIKDLEDKELYLCVREFSHNGNLPVEDITPLYKLINEKLNNTEGSYWSDMDSLFNIEFNDDGFVLQSKDGLTYPKTKVRYKRVVDANYVLKHTNKKNDVKSIEKAKLIDAHIEFDEEKE